jgi:endonuclease/exonuclease/phosphatase family metal-dependent hydrolase
MYACILPRSGIGDMGYSGINRAVRVSCLAAAAILCLSFPSAARTVRVASYNVLFGVGTVNGAEYNAVADVLTRIDADVVAFQELTSGDQSNWEALADDLGYDHTAFGGDGPFSGGLKVGYYSRFPILGTAGITSPQNCGGTTVKELTRQPLRVAVDVPGTQNPLLLWAMHHKASSGNDDRFRRAIEARRITDDIAAYLSANPTHSEYIVLGDMNDDVGDFQTSQYSSLPSGLPGSYQLGCDITFPVPYATFPEDRYEAAGTGMEMLSAFHEDTATDGTYISSGRRLDYIFVSDGIWMNPLGLPSAEVYNSTQDDGVGGVPKAGSPLQAATSTTASDHYAIFADFEMADAVPVSTTLSVVSVDAQGAHLSFDSALNQVYTIQFADSINGPGAWSNVTDFVCVPGTGSGMAYTDAGTGTGGNPANSPGRVYRLLVGLE